MVGTLEKYRRTDGFGRFVIGVVFLGVLLRIVFWGIHLPTPKVYFIFNPGAVDTLPYLLSFESSHPLRMPWYDVAAYWTYRVTSWLFGIRAVSFFNLMVSSAALPMFYLGVRELFDRRSALYALILFAFYPKILVMTAGALPEVASASFAAMSLYPLAKVVGGSGRRVSALGGVLATLSFLMFDPAVAFLGLSMVYLYAARADSWFDKSAIDGQLLAFVTPGAVFGGLYLFVGPFASAIRVGTGGDAGFGTGTRELFINPESLSLAEKAVRFVAYSYFDFWWHIRGFDTEGMILTFVGNIEGFLGASYPVLLAGWAALTLALTAGIVLGFTQLSRSHSLVSRFVLLWIASYVVLYLLTNLGWLGAFQTRHVFPVFPAISIAFGVGAAQASELIAGRSLEWQRLANYDVTWSETFAVVLVILTAVLVATAGIQVVLLSGNSAVRDQQPVDELVSVTDPGANVAVVAQRQGNTGIGSIPFREVVLYSGGEIRPVIFTTSIDQADRLREQTVGVVVRAGRPAELIETLRGGGVLFLKTDCSEPTDTHTALLNRALEVNGIHQIQGRTTTGRTTPCVVHVDILKIP
jgi:hypothetical protein